KAICLEAGYYGAGTVEYLVGQDGLVSFLEVNTRLQVEHPVTEETSGIDLVLQQFRIANGEELTITEDPEPRGHSFEFRINGEDAGRGFLPAPGPVTTFTAPSGPGVRVDSGVESGSVIGGQFDSMLAKLIVTGATREEALARSRRALAEFTVDGLATVIPFHAAVVSDPAFIGDGDSFSVHTRWIETEWDNQVPPFTAGQPIDDDEVLPRQSVIVEVGGRRVEVSLPGELTLGGGSGGNAGAVRRKPKARTRGGAGAGAASGDSVTAPMQGTVVKVAVDEGQEVAVGDLVAVLEAMKMENPVTAHKAGTITGLSVTAGDAITQGTVLAEIK
ncbi:ATP-binding protein, partial [Rhodococcoides fascians]|uniref:ATP-binding protein n=1 Tax=Rhodococcoides fascians TaxID=1828 RepID=UPI00117B28A5